jgi:hypothetical protein
MKRPRIKSKPRRFKVVYPEYFGFEPDACLIFEKTQKGYVHQINSGAWIGFPRYLIEGNKHLFMEV